MSKSKRIGMASCKAIIWTNLTKPRTKAELRSIVESEHGGRYAGRFEQSWASLRKAKAVACINDDTPRQWVRAQHADQYTTGDHHDS